LQLPDVWDDAWTFEGERELTTEEFERRARIHLELSRVFGRINHYTTVVAFGKDQGEQLGHLLSDDLGDIYWGLQEGFGVLKAGGSDGEVTYTWRWGFWNHWAEHAVNALRVIHARLAPDSTDIGSGE
jgi:hypothetical protein